MFKGKNWKTTLGGIASILTGLGLIGTGIASAMEGKFTTEPFLAGFGAIAAGIALINAKDNNVSGVGVNATTGPTPPV
jgi:hypothetical protein